MAPVGQDSTQRGCLSPVSRRWAQRPHFCGSCSNLCTRAVKDVAASLSAYLGWNPIPAVVRIDRLTPPDPRAPHLWRKDSD